MKRERWFRSIGKNNAAIRRKLEAAEGDRQRLRGDLRRAETDRDALKERVGELEHDLLLARNERDVARDNH